MSARHLPNTITFARLLGCVVFVGAFSVGRYGSALAIYALCELCDQADGKLAKAFHLESTTGKFFDPFVDSLTHLSAFACLLSVGDLPLWAFTIFLFRELGLSFLRLLASLQGTQLGGHLPGKAKALVHAIVVAALLAERSTLLPARLAPPLLAISLAAAASLLSGLFYALRYRPVLRRAFLDLTP